MPITQLHCIYCEERYDIRGSSVDGATVLCPRCGAALTQNISEWGMRTRRKDPYRKQEYAGCELKKRVGAGRFSFTYRAEHQDHDVPVLMEIFPHDREGYDEEWIKTLFRGLARGAKLRHPNVAVLYDLGRREGYDFSIRELADGGTVRRRLEKDGKIPVGETLPLMEGALRALRVAERKDLYCGRISPDNCLLDYDGSIKLNHFGRPLHPAELEEFRLTISDALTGPCFYVAPEQVEEPTAGSIKGDLYSLGLTMFEMLSGRKAFNGTTAREILESRLEWNAPPLQSVNPKVPDELNEFVGSLTVRNPAERPDGAAEALEQLHEVARKLNQRTDLNDTPTVAGEEDQGQADRFKAFMWTALAFVLLGLSIYPFYRISQWDREADQEAIGEVAPAPRSGRVLIIVEDDGERLGREERLKILTVAAAQVNSLGQLIAVDPFLSAGESYERAGVDGAILRTDPTYVMRIRASSDSEEDAEVTLAALKGSEWTVQQPVESADQPELNTVIRGVLEQAAERMKVEEFVPPKSHSEDFWDRLARAVKAERRADFEGAMKLVSGSGDGTDRTSVIARILRQYWALVRGLHRSEPVTEGEFTVEEKVTGEWAALAEVLEDVQSGGPEGLRRALAEYLAEQPDSPRGHYLLGLWRMHTGRTREDSLAAFWKAIESDPGYLPAVFEAADLVHRGDSGELDDLLSRYREVAWRPEHIDRVQEYCDDLRADSPTDSLPDAKTE
ncbi:MAG: protein kinase domain-containing protein [Candidatus Brocadiia bacterium]